VEPVIDYLSRVARNDWWVVAIELLLIGFVVYWLVDFLEGTRGERLFRGVIFILIAGFLILKLVVGQFELDRLQYLYSGFLIFVLIIAVAAFQPEIRRALIRIGKPRFLTGSAQQMVRIVEEIITGVTQLSARKTGAIIVLERRVALGEFIETGVRINAKLTAELLRTIFHPGTTLHDMAVIIRGDRIVAARVQLPLAEAGPTADFELGSRHRAAMGITAGSDAVCLVVSEETGTISLAQDGKLYRDMKQPRLRELLIGAMGDMVTPSFTGLMELFRKPPKKKSQPQTKKASENV
jgi:diadenylate cyclase